MRALLGPVLLVLIAASAAGTAIAGPLAAAPAKTDIQKVRWRDKVIKIAVSSSLMGPGSSIKADSDVVGAIRRSLDAWQKAANVSFQLEFSDRQSVSPAGVQGDGVNLITIAQTPENVLFFSNGSSGMPARTRTFYNRKGSISETDIVLNPFQIFSTDGSFATFDLEAVLIHEIGHLLGLRHSFVIGSAMAESVAKNGVFAASVGVKRAVSESDASALRDLYGAADDEDCCAAVAGRLTFTNGRGAKGIRVWAEEDGTGKVLGDVETAADGSFRLGGLASGSAIVFWQKSDDPMATQIGEIGLYRLSKGTTETVNEKIAVSGPPYELRFIGLNARLAESALRLAPGGEYVVYLGGKDIDAASVNIEFNSPYFRVSRSSIEAESFPDGVSAVSFVLSVDQAAPPGNYSVFSIDRSGIRSALVGAINVE